jgi:hypothetical protein
MTRQSPRSAWQRALLMPLRALKATLGGLLALLILFEEWGWEPLQRVLARIGAWPGLRWVETAIRRLPPYAALGLFALPTLMLLPVKLGALWLIGQGQVVAGARPGPGARRACSSIAFAGAGGSSGRPRAGAERRVHAGKVLKPTRLVIVQRFPRSVRCRPP